MPVQLGSRLPAEKEARIEIIPLIDIMFFLLAAFMLVSLSLVTLRSIPVELPTATSASRERSRDLLSVSVDKAGLLHLEGAPIGPHALVLQLAAWRETNARVRVFISGDTATRHGDVIRALDLVRSAGIDQVAFEIGEPPATQLPSETEP